MCSPPDSLLQKLVQRTSARRVVEVGFFTGCVHPSAVHALYAAADVKRARGVQCTNQIEPRLQRQYLPVIGASSGVIVTTYSVKPHRACSACQSVLLQVLCSRHVALALMAGGKLIAYGATDEHGSEGAGPPN